VKERVVVFEKLIENNTRFPMLICIGQENILLNDIPPGSPGFQKILDSVKKNKELKLAFFSSQPPFVFEMIHTICDTFMSGISQKIDTLLREIVKNGEKENITLIAKKTGLLGNEAECAPLSLMRKVLNEDYCLDGEKIPLLYKFPEIYVTIYIQVKENDLHIEIENHGFISKQNQNMIQKRIETGRDLAQFDLRQEFEMKNFKDCRETIRGFFHGEGGHSNFDDIWKSANDQSFDDYWLESPYFVCINSGVHSSFYPHFTVCYQQLRAEFKKRECPLEVHFSAGMGYIQCAFVIEANRNLYGTYGKIFTPRNQGDRTMAGFKIGLTKLEIEI
jgi:hypothetical protein